MKRLWPVMFFVLLTLSPRPGGAAIVVTTNVDEKKPNGTCTLREAVQTALDYASGGSLFYPECTATTGKDLIEFKPGLGTIELPELGWINLSSSLTIQGPAPDDLQEISGAGKTRIFAISNGSTVKLKNLSLTKGRIQGEGNSGSGAGLLVDGGSANVTIENCWFHDNEAGRGGAIAFHGWHLTIRNSAFDANESLTDGGAIEGGANMVIEDTAFEGNYAVQGGGAVYCSGSDASTLEITSSTLVANTAAGKRPKGLAVPGGGAVMSSCKTEIEDSLFRSNLVYGEVLTPDDNSAKNAGGGGLFLAYGGFGTVSRSVFQWNQAGVGPKEIASGGAIYARGNLDVDGCALENNIAAGGHGGGGILFDSSYGEVLNTSLRENSSVVDDWVWPQPPKDPSPGAAIAVVGPATVEITNSTLAGNFGTSEISDSGYGSLSFRNALIGDWSTKEACEATATTLIFNLGGNFNYSADDDCDFPPDFLEADPKPFVFPVTVPNYDLEFTYLIPIFMEGSGTGDCSNGPHVDLIGTTRAANCTAGAIEVEQ
jgi:CSLREA domain-containing protein